MQAPFKSDAFSAVPNDVWSDGEDNASYWNTGIAEFGFVNNDNVADIFVNFTREEFIDGVCCDNDAGPSMIGLSNGFDYTWTVLEDSIQYWQDGNIEFADFDATVQAATDFAIENQDTLILVTADHATGGLVLQRPRGSNLRAVSNGTRLPSYATDKRAFAAG